MPSESKPNGKKRASSSESLNNEAQDGDHRKRRRNRTTQSCLNCHTSKRMCDRGRPCSRCRQLGLTGLCVYEVDDPNQRSEPLDEGSRLKQRVAELEGVIREMKNKPHPRWVQSGSNPELEKWHSRAQARAGENATSDSGGSNASSSPMLVDRSSDSDGSEPTTMSIAPLSRALSPPRAGHMSPGSMASGSPPTHHSYHSTPSSLGTLSPALMTPTDELSASVGIAGEQFGLPPDFDFASMFMSYPELLSGTSPHVDARHMQDMALSQHQQVCSAQGTDHCGCLDEHLGYNTILELSLRLRKAADTLSRSTNHRMGARCLLNQRVNELDAFSTTVLGNTTYPPENFNVPNSSHNQPRPHIQPSNSVFGQETRRPSLSVTTRATQHLGGLHAWDSMQPSSGAPAFDDGFMSWRGPSASC